MAAHMITKTTNARTAFLRVDKKNGREFPEIPVLR